VAVTDSREEAAAEAGRRRPARARHGADEPAVPRRRVSVVALIGLAAAGLLVTALVIGPFVPSLVWALTFAVVVGPLHRKLARRFKRPMIAAGASVIVVALVLVVPAVFLAWQISHEAAEGLSYLNQQVQSGELQKTLGRYPRVQQFIGLVAGRVDVAGLLANALPAVQSQLTSWLAATTWAVVQILVALFALFFFLRDHDACLKLVRSLLPLSTDESGFLFKQVRDTVQATVYGTFVVAMVQGALGGVMFLILGIPGAVLWAVAMALLSIVPTLGAFVIWLPAAAVFALQGHWGKATLLASWGLFVVGTIDNLLYPFLVGKEMRLHTLAVFLAVVGGLALFGAVGVVLGPILMAGTLALVDILREREV
jgi:predicted PurR-regulated permease PerM